MIRLAFILCFVSGVINAQVFGYQGKTLAIDAGIGITPNPGLISAMRYGEANDEPAGIAIPWTLNIDLEKTIGLRSVVTAGFSFYRLFNGFRIPSTMSKLENDFKGGGIYIVNSDEYTSNGYTLVPSQELRVNAKNYTSSVYDIDIGIKLFTGRYIAPMGKFFDFRIGASTINYSKNTYEYTVRQYRTVPILPVLTDTVTQVIVTSNTKMFPYLKLGYGARTLLGKTKGLFVEYNIFTSFVLNTNKFSVQSSWLKSNYSFESPNEEGLVYGASYAFLKKQKLFSVLFKIGYMF